MIGRLIVLITMTVLVAGCAGVKINPVATQTAMINVKEGSSTEAISGITINVKPRPFALPTAQPSVNIASFEVVVSNNSSADIDLSLSSIVLVADGKKQLRPASIEDLTAILKKETFYLIPSPYIGYYYLEDREHGAAMNQFESSLPFYVEYYPEELISSAFPFGVIKAGLEVRGEVFFLADFAAYNYLELRLQPNMGSAPAQEFKLPFSIEK